jgi:general secretion pathway protein F
MASFDFVALDVRGKERQGLLEAENEGEARRLLEQRQWVPLQLVAASGTAQRALRPGRALRSKDLALFTRQLATLATVSPLEEALFTIGSQAGRPDVRHALLETHAHLVQGRRLSEAMESVPGAFPPLYRAMVAAGEGSGALPVILERLADMLESHQQLRGKLTTALVYPAALAVTATGVVIALMTFVVPKIVDQFESMGRVLPLLTRSVIAVSEFMVVWGLPLLAVGFAAAVAAAMALRRPAARLRLDRWLLRLPLVGKLLRDVHASLFARTLATMVASGLPLMEGLAVTARTVQNRALRAATEGMVTAIREGSSLSSAMRGAAIFPPTLLYMAASGEDSGRLAPMLDRAADYLDREFSTFTSVVLSLLEPAIIIALGGVITLIVLAILLPILQFNSMVMA